jgi:uncharacterized membrane protein (DUF485 family)
LTFYYNIGLILNVFRKIRQYEGVQKLVEKKGNRQNKSRALPDYIAIEESASFKSLIRKKKRFLIPSTILFLGLYILFPLIISYTNVLNVSFIGDISWSWVYALGLFVMTWVFVTVYMKKAAEFDKMANETLKEFNYLKESNL